MQPTLFVPVKLFLGRMQIFENETFRASHISFRWLSQKLSSWKTFIQNDLTIDQLLFDQKYNLWFIYQTNRRQGL